MSAPHTQAHSARPALNFSPELLLRARGPGSGIRLVLFDVDGVLTDGRLYIGEQGESFKAFHSLDGQGLKHLQAAGITPAIITGRDSPAVRRRLQELGIAQGHFGVHDKLATAQALLAQLGLTWEETAAIGDDWPDLPLLLRAGFACAPPNAHPEVLQRATHITAATGGAGAVRELCDLLLVAHGRYASLLRAQLGSAEST